MTDDQTVPEWDRLRVQARWTYVALILFGSLGLFWLWHLVRSLADGRYLDAAFYACASAACASVLWASGLVLRNRVRYTAVPGTADSVPGGIRFVTSRRLRVAYRGALTLIALSSGLFAVGMWLGQSNFPMSPGQALIFPWVAVAIAGYSAGALAWFAVGFLRFPCVDVSPAGLDITGFRSKQTVRWDDVADIVPLADGKNPEIDIVLKDRARAGVDIFYRGPFAPAYMQAQRSVRITADLFAVGAVPLLDFIDYYAFSPDDRAELADGRALRRLASMGQPTLDR
ncbi:hypothetical protein SAMN04488548_1341163 [Gordonia westfalica]|uniref:PH domain-containing protein n=2 Tax=Gordonia westfalica TaxID=158898 RepID=A0A1H2II85_9ACTN|nr:hypothetical protein SAMN04488548_1341163 [Gordonia westfalica]